MTSNADAGGSCPAANCTLPQAIATASNGDRINFAGMATINLTSGGLLINMNLLSVQRSAASATPDFRSSNIASPGANTAIPGLK